MSSLRSGIEELRAEDLGAVSDAGIEADLVEIERASRGLEAERARRLREAERRGLHEREGHLSIGAWLARATGIGRREAARKARLARSLQEMPRAREALADGEVPLSSVGVLAVARDAHPEEFASHEEMLVSFARDLPPRDLHRSVHHWREALAPERVEEDAERLHERRRLHVSKTFGGMIRLDGDLDPESGEAVLTALAAVTDAEARRGRRPAGRPAAEDRRRPAQRRADALAQICRRYLDRGDRPVVAGERPHVTAIVDVSALEGGAGRAELAHAGPITARQARRIACDASVARVITRGASEPLEAGRRTPVVPPAMRRALVVRDGGCRFPGCGRPQAWCDAHHVVHWADGGETGLSNLVLVCRPHHRMLHRRPGGFGVRMGARGPVFAAPEGSTIEDRAPPLGRSRAAPRGDPYGI